MTDLNIITLNRGDLALNLAPAVGGGIAGFTWRGLDVLRPASADSLRARDPLGLSCYPLTPFCGRIAKGRFEFEGRFVDLPANLPGQSHAIHGQAWQAPWTCEVHSSGHGRMHYEHSAGDWPWAYRVEQVFELQDDRLVQTLSLENHGDSPMPAGMGLHPFFPRTADLKLVAPVTGYFPNDGDMLPGRVSKIPSGWDWTKGQILTPSIDHQFTGWNGTAQLIWPSRGLQVTMTTDPELSYLVVYAPPGKDFVCVEPVSHANNGLNRSPNGTRDGMKVLAPGQRMTICVTLEMKP
jgi:aldose 1-epimerase